MEAHRDNGIGPLANRGRRVGLAFRSARGHWISDANYRCVYVLHESPAVCSQKLSENTKWIQKEGGIVAAIYAFPPVLIGWPVVWGFVVLVRWIRAGFRQE